jgi:hypothetical protein
MTRFMASAPLSGRGMAHAPTGSGAPFRPAGSGRIVITSIPRMRRSAATNNPALAAKTKMMLNHYQQTKNLMVSYSPKALGFF